MKNQKKKSFPRRVFLWLLAILLAVCIAFGIPTIFLYVTGEWPGLFLLFREPALNTNGTYG